MSIDKPDFAILGAGALGSILGGHLARAGRSVVLLARPARASQIERDGIRLQGLACWTQPVPVLANPADFAGAGVLIVATKTYGTSAALEPLRHARVDLALSVQNGLMKNEQLGAAFGAGRVLGAIADVSGELRAGGEVLFTRNEQLCVGELHGHAPDRAAAVAQALAAAGIRASSVPDIESLEWSKFASWAGLMILSVTTRECSAAFLTEPATATVLVRVVREIGCLAHRCGIALSDRSTLPVASLCAGSESQAIDSVLRFGAQLKLAAPTHRMSSLQDLEAGRPLEIDETLGYAVRRGRGLGLDLPLLNTFLSLTAGIDHLRRGVTPGSSPRN